LVAQKSYRSKSYFSSMDREIDAFEGKKAKYNNAAVADWKD